MGKYIGYYVYHRVLLTMVPRNGLDSYLACMCVLIRVQHNKAPKFMNAVFLHDLTLLQPTLVFPQKTVNHDRNRYISWVWCALIS